MYQFENITQDSRRTTGILSLTPRTQRPLRERLSGIWDLEFEVCSSIFAHKVLVYAKREDTGNRRQRANWGGAYNGTPENLW